MNLELDERIVTDGYNAYWNYERLNANPYIGLPSNLDECEALGEKRLAWVKGYFQAQGEDTGFFCSSRIK